MPGLQGKPRVTNDRVSIVDDVGVAGQADVLSSQWSTGVPPSAAYQRSTVECADSIGGNRFVVMRSQSRRITVELAAFPEDTDEDIVGHSFFKANLDLG